MFIALAYTKMNTLRRNKLEWARASGYGLTSYISPRLTTFENVTTGVNCFILEDNTIQPFVTIGENVTLWSGNHIGHHSVIEDDVFIASHVVVSGGVHVGRGAFIGVNATLRDHITIGDFSVIGAGAVILGDTASETVYASTPTPPRDISSSKLRKI
jgi:sugar O-acyltransferase (sialic acid O-acetyltransferase NeuD family)